MSYEAEIDDIIYEEDNKKITDTSIKAKKNNFENFI